MNIKTIYLISGGQASDFRQMIRDFHKVLQTCGKSKPKVAYVGTANLENMNFFQRMKQPIKEAGAGDVVLVPVVHNADIPAAKNILSEADAVFLAGGEVEDGMVWLRKSGLDVLLAELYNSGKLFFGVSAGAIMMGQYWVHWDTEGDDNTSRLFPCLNFVPMTFDTHCENENWKELKCALRLMGPGSRGYGLSSGGFYSADSEGNLKNFRIEPAVFCNTGGIITQVNGQ
ncbi:MAG: Type 1 glutamine amidotransferase-like domain-containing protein [Clostridiales bacterium]|jgi:peptidase E|nr:Type 1 glutamine amidotransferase-like domain-containing protein [Clostridiales bacterium]